MGRRWRWRPAFDGPLPACARLGRAGLALYEPPGQDGRTCQILAVLDQLLRAGALPVGTTGAWLEKQLVHWITEHASDVVGVHGARGDAAALDYVAHGFEADELKDILSFAAWHNSGSLMAMLAMLKTELEIQARVHVFDSRGEAYDCVLYAHEAYDVRPTMTLVLGFHAELHYFSVVPVCIHTLHTPHIRTPGTRAHAGRTQGCERRCCWPRACAAG